LTLIFSPGCHRRRGRSALFRPTCLIMWSVTFLAWESGCASFMAESSSATCTPTSSPSTTQRMRFHLNIIQDAVKHFQVNNTEFFVNLAAGPRAGIDTSAPIPGFPIFGHVSSDVHIDIGIPDSNMARTPSTQQIRSLLSHGKTKRLGFSSVEPQLILTWRLIIGTSRPVFEGPSSQQRVLMA
jgi:hypothetical protein